MSDYKDFIYETNLFDNYNTKRMLVDTDFAVKGIPYVFFSTPMLNLKESCLSSNSFLTYMMAFYPEILSMLSYGVDNGDSESYTTTSPIIKLLTNTIQSFDSNDHSLGTMDYGESWIGTKMVMPTTNLNSNIIGGSVSCRFNDLASYPVLNLINAWFQYISDVGIGKITTDSDNIYNKKIDFTSSIYYFLTEMDGETIRYWSKYTGVFPTNVPFSSMGTTYNNQHDLVEYNIDFAYSIKEDMDFNILTDFNKLVSGNTSILYKDDDEPSIQTLPLVTQKAYEFLGNLTGGNESYKMNHPDFVETEKANVNIVLAQRESNNGYFIDETIKPKLNFTND